MTFEFRGGLFDGLEIENPPEALYHRRLGGWLCGRDDCQGHLAGPDKAPLNAVIYLLTEEHPDRRVYEIADLLSQRWGRDRETVPAGRRPVPVPA